MNILFIALPVFLIIFAGWLMKRNGIVKSDWIHILNQFAYYVALPALIITSFWAKEFNLEKDIIGNTILISTILSFFAIPFILFLI